MDLWLLSSREDHPECIQQHEPGMLLNGSRNLLPLRLRDELRQLFYLLPHLPSPHEELLAESLRIGVPQLRQNVTPDFT